MGKILEYDNVRDSKSYGYDSGVIVEGKVVLDEDKNEFVVVDDDGKAFSTQDFLKSHLGRSVRFTCIDMESAEHIEKMLQNLQAGQPGGQ